MISISYDTFSMKIYTRTGDAGNTVLFGGRRVSKHHIRLEAYGTVDELNALLGLAESLGPHPDVAAAIRRLQHELFALGADLATPLDIEHHRVRRIQAGDVARLESDIDAWQEILPSLQTFILPGGNPPAAVLHTARTVCRRAERAAVALADQEPINKTALRYLNRLSDWLFVLARLQNHQQGMSDIPWQNILPDDEVL